VEETVTTDSFPGNGRELIIEYRRMPKAVIKENNVELLTLK
jgi:hypothetical protein